MQRGEQEVATELPRRFLTKTVCFLCSIVIVLTSLLASLMQLLAYMNMDFGYTPHLLIFVVGWIIVLTCLWCGFSIVRPPSWQSLKRLLIAVPLLAFFFWLYSQPFANGLMN